MFNNIYARSGNEQYWKGYFCIREFVGQQAHSWLLDVPQTDLGNLQVLPEYV